MSQTGRDKDIGISLGSYLLDLGYGATFTSNVIFAVLEQLSIYPSNAPSKINEQEVGRTLAMMISVPTGLKENPALRSLTFDILNEQENDQMSKMKTWNAELFFPLIMKMNPKMEWSRVLRYLDHPDVVFVDPSSLAIVLKASKAVIQDMSLFPTSIFLEQWKNPNAQLSFLNQAIRLTPEIFTLNQGLTRKVISPDMTARSNLATSLMNAASSSPWNSLELVQLLIILSDSPAAGTVREIFEFGIQTSPDILLLAIAQLRPEKVSIKKLAAGLVRLLIGGHPHAPIVLPRVWQLAPDVFASGLVLLYSEDPTSISRILDIAQELKALEAILECRPFGFAIDLAAIASRREYLNLEKWLRDHIAEHGDAFYRSCLDFLNEKVNAAARPDGIHSVPLSVEVTRIFFRVLNDTGNMVSPESVELLRRIFAIFSQVLPRTENIKEEQAEAPVEFPADLEEEALRHYEQLYRGDLTIAQVVDLLKKFKNSASLREQDMFKCMIQYLFDEYKYFSRYPERHLLITAVLFGALIQNQIVTSMALGIALRFVLEALRQPAGTSLFKFGVHAIAQFQSRLPEWPQYCALLLQIEQLHHTIPEIIQFIKSIPAQIPAPEHPQAPSLFKSLNLNGLLRNIAFAVETPPEQIRDKMLFAINNLSFTNLETKVSEVNEMLRPQYYRWFSHYIVVKRASQEPNFHSLYIAFVDALKMNHLDNIILFETLSEIRDLLDSEKTLTSAQERTLLKNLGTWLGSMTLAKNKPIKHQYLSFKDLLLEGYDHKRLIVVIPFVCKVLEMSNDSIVFKPPNPWLMAVMRLLTELYHFAELKLNLKFEIEVLCKNIKLDINTITPSEILRNRQTQLKEYEKPPEPKEEPSAVGSFVVFNPSIPLFNARPQLKRLVQIAIDRSIREVITSPVVERSVTIAVITTREIIIKDFALEPNEEKMRKAAHCMVQSLAGSLASVSSREPLRVSMVSNLRNLFLQNGFTEQTVPDQIVFVVVSDNIDLACTFMEKAAAEKSIAEIDESLQMQFQARSKHRELRSGQPFVDIQVYGASRYPAALPDPLRLRPGGLVASQMSVYEDFVDPKPQPPPAPVVQKESEPEDAVLTNVKVVEKFSGIIAELDQILVDNSNAKLAQLSGQPQVQQLVQQIMWLVSKAPQPDEIAMVFAQKLVSLLYKDPSAESGELYVWLLVKLVDASPKTFREFREWLLYQDDERKFSVKITVQFIRADLIAVQEVDMQLARLIESGKQHVLRHAMDLIRTCVIEQKLSSFVDFIHCIECMQRLTQKGRAVEGVENLLSSLKQSSAVFRIQQLNQRDPGYDEQLRQFLAVLFKEWIQICMHPGSSEKTQLQFVNQILAQGLLKVDSVTPLFFRVCCELAVDSFASSAQSPYEAVDAFSHLIVLLVLNYTDGPDQNHARLNLMAKVLSIVVLVLVHDHEKNKQKFNQRPFFRLFSSLLNDLSTYSAQLDTIYIQILSAMSNTLHTLQPQFLPGFTFGWVQLISHRNFMPMLLQAEHLKFWPFYQRLLVDLFKYLAPHLQEIRLSAPMRVLYQATLRLLLVLLHDFPEFLCDYHFSFVDVIPHSCIQLRNLILSAFPRNMRLPDPFTPNLKVDLLPEINQSPRILSDYTSPLLANNLKQDIDLYMKSRSPVSFLIDLQSRLLNKDKSKGQYNVSVINALVLYVGVQAIAQAQNKLVQGAPPVSHNIPMDIFQHLAVDLDNEGRYIFLSAIANQLRYSNSHTHYFSVVLLYLFEEASKPIIQEQITRVLVERLIVNRPHPYGLLITFIELIRNQRYNFWEHSFISGAPELDRLFQNVAKSINASIPRPNAPK
ncbi:CCR4-Not complex component, Not1-domain-containing protein [Gorgonomyces haynaldii]|nr:CCR4-Not complex component, Not1-domain-containing protein [Gorgonomyces haynaldii]